MLLILLQWLVVIFISYTTGFVVRRLFVPGEHRNTVAITILWGWFTISLVATPLMFFIPADFFMLLLFFLAATVIQFFSREEIARRLHLFRLLVLGRKELIQGGFLLFALLAFSAHPAEVDDGHYYAQTMLWFSQEGLVNGISNLMLPLGQGSSWHVLQALFSFSFIDGFRLNDLNGLLVLVFFVHCLENGADRKDNRLLSLLTAITLCVSVPFLSAASPDLPVIVFTVMAFYAVARPFGSRVVTDVLMLAAFAVSVKLSALALALLAVALLAWGFYQRWALPRAVFVLLFLAGVIMISKNIDQTGYPLYPWKGLGVDGFSWTTPPELLDEYMAGIRHRGLTEQTRDVDIARPVDPGLAGTVHLLLSREGINGVINLIILVAFPLILLTIARDVLQKIRSGIPFHALFFLHGIFVVNFVMWLVVAPQYRFILPVYVFYLAWFARTWMKFIPPNSVFSRVYVLPRAAIALLFVASLATLVVDLSTAGSHRGRREGVGLSTLVTPHVPRSHAIVDSLTVNGQTFYHPRGEPCCGDSPLPCLSPDWYGHLRDRGYDLHTVRARGRWAFLLK